MRARRSTHELAITRARAGTGVVDEAIHRPPAERAQLYGRGVGRDRVRATARAYGGPEAEVHELAGYGHLDVLVARRATHEVFQPALDWLNRHAGR